MNTPTAPLTAGEALKIAARAVVREALDRVIVHPCDENDDAVRAKFLYGPEADLYAALAATEQVQVPSDVLALPTAIMDIPVDSRQHPEYRRGHRDARHAAADLVLARADELAALAQRAGAADKPVAVPVVLFDKDAVHNEITRHLGKSHCIGTYPVMETLDAVVRLLRASPAAAEVTPAPTHKDMK